MLIMWKWKLLKLTIRKRQIKKTLREKAKENRKIRDYGPKLACLLSAGERERERCWIA